MWGEGAPSDIAEFRGEKIILVDNPLMYSKTVNGCRVFGKMKATFQVESELPKEEVESYLEKMKNASEEEQKEGYKINKTKIGDITPPLRENMLDFA